MKLTIRVYRLAFVFTILSVSATAQLLVPFEGRIAVNSGAPPVTADITVRLFAVPTGDNEALWEELHEGVSITVTGGMGAFSVRLGSAQPLISRVSVRIIDNAVDANGDGNISFDEARLVSGAGTWTVDEFEQSLVDMDTNGDMLLDQFELLDGRGLLLEEVLDGSSRYLEIQLSGEPPLFPRQQILFSPRVIHAEHATTARIASRLEDGVAAPSEYPVGSIMVWPGRIPLAGSPENFIPDGWLLCDGSSRRKDEYAQLYEVIRDDWTLGNPGSELFEIPDFRGLFMRGVQGTRANDDNARGVWWGEQSIGNRMAINSSRPDNGLASMQPDLIQQHTHRVVDSTGTYDSLLQSHRSEENDTISDDFEDFRGDASLITRGQMGNSRSPYDSIHETRPNNVFVHYLIKYR